MDTKSELFDLKKEKQELDQFLSTLADEETLTSPPPKEDTFFDIPKPTPRPTGFDFDEADQRYDQKTTPAKPADTEFEEISFDKTPVKPLDSKPKITSSFLPVDDEDKQTTQPLHAIKTPEAFKAATPPSKMDTTVEMAATKPSFDIATEKKPESVETFDFAPETAKKGKGKWIWFLLGLIIALLAVLLWLYPDTPGRVGSAIQTTVSGALGGAGKGLFSPSVSDVNLTNVRQRLVHNIKIGKSIRVIEGVAENLSKKEISRIKMEAVLYDSNGTKLTTSESLGGNTLTDEKLENLDAKAIQTALQSGKAANEKIPSKGQVPFMIVFTDEPAGVFKMSVTPVNFSKH